MRLHLHFCRVRRMEDWKRHDSGDDDISINTCIRRRVHYSLPGA